MKINSLKIAFYSVFGATMMLSVSVLAYLGINRNALLASLSSGTAAAAGTFQMSQEELVDLVKPSVVRVVQNVKVDAEIPAFKVDFDTKSAVFLDGYKALPIKLETPLVGSGFIVNPDGYILTNAHVVSDESIKRMILAEVINRVVLSNAADVTDTKKKAELVALSKDAKAWHDLGDKIYKEVADKTDFTIDKQISVVNPSAKYEKIEDVKTNGFSAQIIKVNNNYLEDNRDVALIKIDEKNLPAVKLSDVTTFTTGTKIYVFGFPVTGEFSRETLLEPSFTQGVISALKDSFKKEFKILQSDAKISSGSSGGPMLNANGEVIGLITYQTSSQLQESGDNFAFAIPVELGKKMMDEEKIENTSGNYEIHLSTGMALAQDKRCKKAIAEYGLAKNTNDNFQAATYIEPYIKSCNDVIVRGESVDDWWGEMKEKMGGVGYVGWIIIASGTILFAILIVFIVILAKKMKSKEKEISNLEDMMLEEAAKESVQRHELDKIINQGVKPAVSESSVLRPVSPADAQPVPEEIVIKPPMTAMDPQLAAYIRQSREYGLDDAAISVELKKVGWPEDIIQNALSAKGIPGTF